MTRSFFLPHISHLSLTSFFLSFSLFVFLFANFIFVFFSFSLVLWQIFIWACAYLKLLAKIKDPCFFKINEFSVISFFFFSQYIFFFFAFFFFFVSLIFLSLYVPLRFLLFSLYTFSLPLSCGFLSTLYLTFCFIISILFVFLC